MIVMNAIPFILTERATRFERATSWMGTKCSTPELRPLNAHQGNWQSPTESPAFFTFATMPISCLGTSNASFPSAQCSSFRHVPQMLNAFPRLRTIYQIHHFSCGVTEHVGHFAIREARFDQVASVGRAQATSRHLGLNRFIQAGTDRAPTQIQGERPPRPRQTVAIQEDVNGVQRVPAPQEAEQLDGCIVQADYLGLAGLPECLVPFQLEMRRSRPVDVDPRPNQLPHFARPAAGSVDEPQPLFQGKAAVKQGLWFVYRTG